MMRGADQCIDETLVVALVVNVGTEVAKRNAKYSRLIGIGFSTNSRRTLRSYRSA